MGSKQIYQTEYYIVIMHNIKYYKHIAASQHNLNIQKTNIIADEPDLTKSDKALVNNSLRNNIEEKQESLDPSPPRDISKENLVVWVGWTYKSDREVIREAASKALVPLAVKFLGLRKSIEVDKVTEFIHEEVLIWVDELLDRKLVFRVSSILENIGLDPVYELQNLFRKTTKANRREYIGNHLKNLNALPADYERLWTLLDIIIENKALTYPNNSSLEDSVESLEKKSDGWKDYIAVRLFLNTYDKRLIPWIKPEVLWHQLLTTNEVHLLRAWIQIAYSSQTDISSIPESLVLLLRSFPITENMIKDLSGSSLPEDSVETLLNQLAQFGVFIEQENGSLLKVLSRVDAASSVMNIYEILGNKHSNLPIFKFIPMLVEYCLENKLLTVLNACTTNFDLSVVAQKFPDSCYLDLLVDFRNLVADFQQERLLGNILKVVQCICGDGNGDFENYFSDNPLIFLALLILSETACVEKAMSEKSLRLNHGEHFNCLLNLMKQFRLMSSIYFRKTRGVKCSLTYFDLLERHFDVDTRKVFHFHFEGGQVPNFHTAELRAGFAYCTKVSYSFYLKQGRPSMASKRFLLDILKTPKSGHIDGEQCKRKVYKIAIKQFQNASLAAACISFLEILGVDSELLRVSVKAANVLLHSGMDSGNVISLFKNAERDSTIIQTLLDENLMKFIDFQNMMASATEFFKAVKTYDVVVKFSILHDLPLPENFLKYLAQNNLWFPFLLYAQLNNYPLDQIKELCVSFKNPNLLEHIVHSVLHDIHIDETNVLMRERDSRKYLLFKLGVRRSADGTPKGTTDSIRTKSTLSGSLESNASSSTSELLEIDISNTKATLLQILIRCHNSTDPPKALLQASQLYRNPLLAILATSYEPDSVITNWLTWLAVSTDLYEVFTNFESMALSGQQVSTLLDNCMIKRFPKTLFRSCLIFVPDNPLTPFLDFIEQIINKDYETRYLITKLEKFKSSKSNRRASVLSQTDYEMTYLKNKAWLETTALQLLCSALIHNSESLHDQLVFVELLCHINVQRYFSCEVPNFLNLALILKIVFNAGLTPNLADFLDPLKGPESVQNLLDQLTKMSLFSESLAIAQASNLSTDVIVLKKWQNNFENRHESIQDFLSKCNSDFELHQVSPEYVISFFKERASVNDLERYWLLTYSHKWAAKYDLPNRYELERKKILAFVKTPFDINELDDPNINKNYLTYKDMVDILEGIRQPQSDDSSTTSKDKLSEIMTAALDKGNFWLALKLERMFGCGSGDLDILKLCHELAEGLIQLNSEQQQVISRMEEVPKAISGRRRSWFRSTNSMSSDKNNYHYLDLIEEESESPQATQRLILSLIEKLNHGSDLAYSIYMKYRISCNIELPYDIVVSNTDPIKMVKDALQDDCLNKLEVVHDFLEVFDWSKEEITDFICDQFVTAAANYSKSKIDNFTMWDVKVAEQFHLVLKLIKDECSTLGYKFYNFASAVHKQQITADLDFKISEMALVVELLIAAHSCFTNDCNMEGISTVLRKCRKVIAHLLNVRSWKLIVRLLTGIGRYTELNFVFDILRENDQFEFLLSKGSKRDERLKLACIEYLKKYCPQNKQLYELVAIHFNLYSEVAFVWEREAKGYIKNLLAISLAEMQNRKMDPIDLWVLTKSDGTKMLLDKAMEKYVLAAEFHAQGEKLTKAMNAAKQAELIALQKSLLRTVASNETVPCLLDLNGSKIAKLMSKELNFHQSNILAQSYSFSPDWSQILYEQALTNDNITYFDEFAATIGLNDELVQDIVTKFLGGPTVAQFQFKNVKHIIEQSESVHLKYRLASELGFSGLVQEIIAAEEISYLKDTVWKSGYRGRPASKGSDT